MSPGAHSIDDAIARGSTVATQLVTNRDALFTPMAAILLIAGPAGLRACVAGVAEAVIIAHGRGGWGQAAVLVDGGGR